MKSCRTGYNVIWCHKGALLDLERPHAYCWHSSAPASRWRVKITPCNLSWERGGWHQGGMDEMNQENWMLSLCCSRIRRSTFDCVRRFALCIVIKLNNTHDAIPFIKRLDGSLLVLISEWMDRRTGCYFCSLYWVWSLQSEQHDELPPGSVKRNCWRKWNAQTKRTTTLFYYLCVNKAWLRCESSGRGALIRRFPSCCPWQPGPTRWSSS